MNSTRATGSRCIWFVEAPSGRGRLGALAAVFLGAGAAVLVGCRPEAYVSERFGESAPRAVAVATVQNRTIEQLDQVSFGGLVQRTIVGASTYDVPDLLRGGLEEGLIRKSYLVVPCAPAGAVTEADLKRALPPGTPPQPFDAVMYATILSWESDRSSLSSMLMRFRVELIRVPEGELLFAGEFRCGRVDDLRDSSVEDVGATIRRSAQRALASLPQAPRS